MKRRCALLGVAVSCLLYGLSANALEVDPLAENSTAQLVSILNDTTNEGVRIGAAHALALRAPEKWVKLPRGKKEITSAAADPAVVKALLDGLHDKASAVRYACRQGLGRCGNDALDDLLVKLTNEDPDVRSGAAGALGDMGTYLGATDVPLDKAVGPLLTALTDEDYRVRVGAAIALSRIGERAAPAVPQLVKCLDDEEWAVADAAIQALAAADPWGKHAVPGLIAVLNHERHDLRDCACKALAVMGQRARPAIPALIKMLDADRDSWYAGKAAAETLIAMVTYDTRKIKEDPAADIRADVIGAIARSVRDQKTPFVKRDRLNTLFTKHTCPKGREALPALPYALSLLETWMRRPPWGDPRPQLTRFLGEVGPHAADQVVPVVKKLLADPAIRSDAKGTKLLQELLITLEGK